MHFPLQSSLSQLIEFGVFWFCCFVFFFGGRHVGIYAVERVPVRQKSNRWQAQSVYFMIRQSQTMWCTQKSIRRLLTIAVEFCHFFYLRANLPTQVQLTDQIHPHGLHAVTFLVMTPITWYSGNAEHVDPSALLMHLWRRALTSSNFSGPLTFSARHSSNFPASPFMKSSDCCARRSVGSGARSLSMRRQFGLIAPRLQTLGLHLLMCGCFAFYIAGPPHDVCVCLHWFLYLAMHCRWGFNDEHLPAWKLKNSLSASWVLTYI